MSLKRRDEVVLYGLRIVIYTHAHIMKKEPPRTCRTCGYLTSNKHINTEFRDTQKARQKYNTPEHLYVALSPDEESINNILLSMKNIKLYNLV